MLFSHEARGWRSSVKLNYHGFVSRINYLLAFIAQILWKLQAVSLSSPATEPIDLQGILEIWGSTSLGLEECYL